MTCPLTQHYIYCSTHDPHCAWCPITVAHLSLHCTWCLKYCRLIYVSISCGVSLETAAGFQIENIYLFRSVRLWRYIVRICHRAATDGLNRGFVTIPARADNYKFGVCTPAGAEAVKLNQTRQAASWSGCRVFHCMNQKEVGLMRVCAQAIVGHELQCISVFCVLWAPWMNYMANYSNTAWRVLSV